MGLQRFVLMWLVGLLLASVVPEAAAGAEAALRGMAVLEDASGSETIASISTADPARFRTLPGPALEAGYSRSAHWLRFQIEAPAGPWWLDILPSYLDDIRLFEPDLAHPGQFIE
ncbi:MAG: 7TMR-DISMED2 domain-containing protein, partial [Rhodoferax sp.]